MKIFGFWACVFLVALVLLQGCNVRSSRVSGQPIEVSVANNVTNDELADRVFGRLSEIESLQFTAHISRGADSIMVTCLMGPERLRSEMSTKGEPFAIFVLNQETMIEYGRRIESNSGQVSWGVVTYDAPTSEERARNATFKTQFSCLHGTCMYSWVGPRKEVYFKDYLCRMIRKGEVCDRKTFDGVECVLVRRVVPSSVAEDGTKIGSRTDTYWFDDTGMIRRWVSEDMTMGDVPVVTDRQYTNIVINGNIPESSWTKIPPGVIDVANVGHPN